MMKTLLRRCGNVDWKVAAACYLSLIQLSPGLDYFWNLGTNGVWSDPNRWGPLNQVPSGAGNTVEIFTNTAAGHAGGPFYGVTLDADYIIGGFSNISPTANFLATGRTFTVDGPTSFDGYQLTFNTSSYLSNGIFTHDSGHFDLASSTLGGSGSYQKNGGTLNLDTSSLNLATTQTGGTTTITGNFNLNNTFTNSGGTVSVVPGFTFDLNSGELINGGVLDFLGTSGNDFVYIFSDTNLPLTNLPSGNLTIHPGGTGLRRVAVSVDNQGTFTTHTDLEWEKSGAAHSNSGTLNFAGQLLIENAESLNNSGNLTSTGGNLTAFGNLSATSSFDNSGTLDVNDGLLLYHFENLSNSGTININNGSASIATARSTNPHTFINSGPINVAPSSSLRFYEIFNTRKGFLALEPGSTISGGGPIFLDQQTTTLNTTWNPGTSPLNLVNSSIGGIGSLGISSNSALDITNSSLSIPTTSEGDTTFSGSNNVLGAPFTNQVSGTIEFDSTATAQCQIGNTLLTNQGNLLMDNGANGILITRASGSTSSELVNSPGGTVEVHGVGGIRRIAVNIDNQGDFNTSTRTEWRSPDGLYDNSGTITANGELSVEGAETFTNSGTLNSHTDLLTVFGNLSETSTFTNSGTLSVDNGLNFYHIENYLNSGLLEINGGNGSITTARSTNPHLFTNTGDINVAPGSTLTFYEQFNSRMGNLVLAPGSTLDGGGTIALSWQNVDLQYDWHPGDSPLSLTNTNLNNITGNGALTIDDGVPLTITSSNIGVPTSNHGDATSLISNTSNAAFTNEADGTFTLENASRFRIADNDFTNHGQVTYNDGTSTTEFHEASSASIGRFVNSPAGTVVSTGTNREISANVDNQGLFSLGTHFEFNNSGGEHLNSGTINAESTFNIENAESFTNSNTLNSNNDLLTIYGNFSNTSSFNNSGTLQANNGLTLFGFETLTNSGLFDLNSGSALIATARSTNTHTFTNSGDIDVAPGASVTFYDQFNQRQGNLVLESGSSLGGGGAISLSHQNVDLQYNWNPGSSPLSLSLVNLNGAGSLVTSDNVNLTIDGSNLGAGTSNHGDLTLTGNNTSNGSFTNEADGTFTIENAARLRIADNDLTNHGLLTFLDGTGITELYELATTSTGRFLNSPTGTVVSTGTNREISANVTNQGSMIFNNDFEFDNSSGEHLNSGTIAANDTFTILNAESVENSGTINATSENLSLFGTLSATSFFDNSGTLNLFNGLSLARFETLTNSGSMQIHDGTATIATAQSNNAHLFTNSGDIEVAPGASLTFNDATNTRQGNLVLVDGSTLDGGGDIAFSRQNVDLQGEWTPGLSPLSLFSTNLNGVGTLTIADDVSLSLNTSNIGATTSNHGDASSIGSNTSNGAFTNEADGTFTLENASRFRIADNDFTNHGLLTFADGTTLSEFYEATASSAGSFFNSLTGNVVASGTSREISANVNNHGTMTFNDDFEFDNSSGEHLNAGTIAANDTFTIRNAESFGNSGTVDANSEPLSLLGNLSATSLFDNEGVLNLSNGLSIAQFETSTNSGTIQVNGGTATIATAHSTNSLLFTNSGDIEVAPGASLTFNDLFDSRQGNLVLTSGSTLDGGGDIALSRQNVDLQGQWTPGLSPLSLFSTNLDGVGTLTIADDVSLSLNTSNIGATTSNHGDASSIGSNTSNGAFTNETDGTFTLENASRFRIADNDFTNRGELFFADGANLTEIYELSTSSTGRFVNSSTGTVASNGTSREISAEVSNQGLMTFNGPFDFNSPSANHLNSGTIDTNSTFRVLSPESFTNSGTINSNSELLTLSGNSTETSSFNNTGFLNISNGLTLQQFENLTNSGTIQVSGGNAAIATSRGANPNTFTNSGNLNIEGGTTLSFFKLFTGGANGNAINEAAGRLTGSGTVSISQTNFTNNGTIAPGNSTGILTIGPMNHTPSAVLEIEIANNTGPGTGHDQLVVNGNIALNGTLDLTRLNGFVPSPSDTFVIMTATGDITGNFSNINQSQPGNWTVTVDEANDQVLLTFAEDLIFDYSDFQNAYFSPSQIANGDADFYADFDGDGLVNLMEWIHGFDPTSSSHPTAAIAIAQTASTLDLIYPESTLLPVGVYEADVLTNLGLAPPFGLVPRADWTRLADTPIPGQPNIQWVTLRLNNANWNTSAERFFRLQFSQILP